MSAKDLLLSAVTLQNLTAVDIPEVPELDKQIYVRVMTAGERQLYAEVAIQAREAGAFMSDYEIVAICACEANGTPMFHERQPDGRLKVSAEDVAKILNVDGRAIWRIAKKALEVSGLDLGGPDRAKKDSAPSDDDSSSGSPGTSAAP